MTDPTALPNFPPPADEHPLRGRLLDILIDGGLQPSLDSEGDIQLTVEDQTLFIRAMEGDVDSMRVFGQWRVSEQVTQDLNERLLNCNELNLNVNLLKAGIAAGFLVMTCEHLIMKDESTEALQAKVQISLNLILQGVAAWHQALAAEREQPWTAQLVPGEDGMPEDGPAIEDQP